MTLDKTIRILMLGLLIATGFAFLGGRRET